MSSRRIRVSLLVAAFSLSHAALALGGGGTPPLVRDASSVVSGTPLVEALALESSERPSASSLSRGPSAHSAGDRLVARAPSLPARYAVSIDGEVVFEGSRVELADWLSRTPESRSLAPIHDRDGLRWRCVPRSVEVTADGRLEWEYSTLDCFPVVG